MSTDVCGGGSEVVGAFPQHNDPKSNTVTAHANHCNQLKVSLSGTTL